MKKVGLITCFLNNYGACLQALALQKQIEEIGECECRIIAYIGNPGYFYDDSFSIFKLKIRNVTSSFINFLKGKGFIGIGQRHLAFHKFRTKYLRFECVGNTDKVKFYKSIEELNDTCDLYDMFVCGSDQIWNPVFYGKNHPVHFLRFAKGKRKIAYAPSIGVSEMPDEYRETFVEYVNDFHSLSSREHEGSEIIKKLSGREAKTVLDPTLLAGIDFWNLLTSKRYIPKYKKYIFCYVFSDTSKCSEYIKSVQQKTGFPIIYVNVSNIIYDETNSFCEKNKGPIEFLQLLKNAEFILTDSFHGTAFSLIFNKEFYVFERERTDEDIDMSSRIKSILKITGTEERFISLDDDFEIKKSLDYSLINKKLEISREESRNYLRSALKDE